MKAKLFRSLFILTLLPVELYGQVIPGPIDDNAFMDLSQKRSQLNSSISYLISQINNLNIPDTFSIKRAIESADYSLTYFETKAKFQKPVPAGGIDSNKVSIEYFARQSGQLRDSLMQARTDFQIKKMLTARLDSSQQSQVCHIWFRLRSSIRDTL
jgi:hypothetical protein